MASNSVSKKDSDSLEVQAIDALLSRDDLEEMPVSSEYIDSLFESLGISPEDSEYTASGFRRVEKNELLDVPLAILQWEHKPSKEFGGLYCVVYAVNMQTEEKVVFADGGTGIAKQLLRETQRRQDAGYPPATWFQGMKVKNGLVRSDYDAHENAEGVLIPAGTTYYLG